MRRIDERQPAHAAEEHEGHEHAPGQSVRLCGHADRKAHGADGRGSFKETVQKGQPFPVADEEASCQKQYKIHEKNGERLPDGFRGKAPSEAFHIPPQEEGRRSGCQQHEKGGGLDAACGGARPAADEHENDQHHPPRLGKGHKVHGIEAGGAGRDGLEKRSQEPSVSRHARKIKEVEKKRRSGNQADRRHENHLCLEAVPGDAAAVGNQVRPGDEAQPAADDKSHDGKIDDRIVRIVHQRASRLDDAQQIKAGIAEGGYGMKNRKPYPPDEPEIGNEYGSHQAGAEKLKAQGAPENQPQNPHKSSDLRSCHGFLQGASLHQADMPAGKNSEHHGQCHHSHAADLYENQNDKLAEEGPVGAGIHGDKTGDAYGRYGGEKGIRQPRPVMGGKGQHQQQGSCGNGRRKADSNDLKG